MKEVFLLTKVLLKSSISSNNQKKQGPLKFVGWALLFVYIAGIIGYISFQAISALQPINQEAVFLSLCLMIILGMIIMRALFSSINVLFFSKDIEILLPLPIKSYKIIMAKINCMIISEYIISSVIFLPALLVYGHLLKLSLYFYIIGILIMLIIPIIPVLIISLFMTLIMKFTNIIRNKDFVQYITIILTLVLVFGVQFLTTMDQQITNEELANMLVEANGLVEAYTKFFFTLKPAMQALIQYNSIEGFLNLATIILETGVIYFCVISIMSKFYIKTVTNITTGITNKKRKNRNEKDLYTPKTQCYSYVKKEFQNLTRNPIFLMQCVIPSILFPIIFLFPMYISMRNGQMGDVNQIKLIILQGIETPFGVAISVSILMFFYMFNYISITSISRDGENAIFMKYIPISLEKQCFYKILPGIILNFVPTIYLTIGLKILLGNNISIQTLIWINLIGILINILNNYLSIIIDLKRPKLHWSTEYAVVKQNLNMLWEILIYLVKGLILIFWGFKIHNLQAFGIPVCLLLLLMIRQVKKYLYTEESKLFEKIM